MKKRNNTFADNLVIAHRGAWKTKNFPENSIASLREAIRLRCRGSEFDVMMTADGVLVVNHDPHFHQLIVEESPYQQLGNHQLSNGEQLPTLREYLIAGTTDNEHTQLVCEIKPSEISKERGLAVAKKILELVKELKSQDSVCYISFDYDILMEIHRLDPKAITQYLEADKPLEQLKNDGISGIDYDCGAFKNRPEWIPAAQSMGLTLNAWTVNEVEEMDEFIADKFDFITTDEPELLFERIKRYQSGIAKHQTHHNEPQIKRNLHHFYRQTHLNHVFLINIL